MAPTQNIAQNGGAVNSVIGIMLPRAGEGTTLPRVSDLYGGHTPQMQRTIAEYQNAVDENLVEFARQVNNLPDKRVADTMNYELSEVKRREAQDIKSRRR